jgi:hypothetical protein
MKAGELTLSRRRLSCTGALLGSGIVAGCGMQWLALGMRLLHSCLTKYAEIQNDRGLEFRRCIAGANTVQKNLALWRGFRLIPNSFSSPVWCFALPQAAFP